MIEINENLLGLLIAGPIALALGLGFLFAWITEKWGERPKEAPDWAAFFILAYFLVLASAVIISIGFIFNGFKDGVS